MHRLFFLFFAFALIMSSCEEQAPPVLANETKIIKSITSLWGGVCTIESKKNVLPDTGYTVVITLKTTSNFKHNSVPQEHIASSMALIAAKKMTNEERWKKMDVKCIIEQYEGGSRKSNYEIYYSAAKIKKAVDAEGYFSYCAHQIRSRELTALFQHFDTSFISTETIERQKGGIDTLSGQLRAAYGLAYADSLISFSYSTYQQKNHNNIEVLNYYGFILYEHKVVTFNVAVFPEKDFEDKFLFSMEIQK